MDSNNLKKLIDEKYISVQKHPTENLFIYNYTQKAQYDKMWNEETMACRGLIMDGNGNVIARPFKKFFNFEEIEGKIPNDNFKVYEKYDGSLGILYWIGNEPFIATRGSFISDQAIKATAILRTIDCSTLNRNYTYLFEIIFPENRIVVDYGKDEKLVLLAIIETASGKELPLESNIFETAKLMQNGEKLFDFNRIIPMPKELDGTNSPAEIVPDDDIQKELLAWDKSDFKNGRMPISESQSKELIAKYGANNWYDWCIDNWGTKWNSYEVSYSDDKKEIVFDTAWSCPLPVIVALSEKFKDTTFTLKYADEKIGNNCGTVVLLNGEILSQEEGDDKFACEVKGYDYEELLKETEEN